LNYSRVEILVIMTLFFSAFSASNYFPASRVILFSDMSNNTFNGDWLIIIWSVYIPLAFLTIYPYFRYNPQKDLNPERRHQREEYRVIFAIVSKGENIKPLSRSIKSVLFWAPRYLKNWLIEVIVEEDLPKESSEYLNSLISEKLMIIKVPKNYETKNKTKYKARALNYAIEVRKDRGEINQRTWIYHMDEESVVGEDTILGIIDFIEGEGRNKVLGIGLIVYPINWGKNLIVSFADTLRPSDDLGKYRLQAKIGKALFGIHGSHILIRSDVEYKIGWDFGSSRAEDMQFAFRLKNEFSNPIGWLKGRLYEQSPLTLIDYFKQRRRWFKGTLDCIKDKKIVLPYRMLLIFSLIIWLNGLPSFIAAIMSFIISMSFPPYFSVLGAISTSILFFLSWEGFKLNTLLVSVRRRNLYKILCLIVLPLISFLESSTAWFSLFSKGVKYEVVKKE